MRHFPHETLNTEQFSLSQFTRAMQESMASSDPMEYINVALCGRTMVEHGNEQVPHRALVNARLDLQHPANPQFTRDFDSAIGVTRNLPFTAAFNVYPVPSFRDTLKRPNHVLGPIYQRGRTKDVPLNKIPNCALGTVGHRHITRIFFPALYNDATQPVLTSTQLAQLYDECIRPTVMQVIPAHASHWPVDYKSAMQQAKDTAGHFHLGGLKGGTAHGEEDRQPEEAFKAFFENVDMHRVDPNNWLVDVGLEVYDPGMVVQWSKFSHSAILKYILPALDSEDIQALQRRRTFHLDNVAQLDNFAGFRSSHWNLEAEVL
ncbi:hypothetical protein EDB86DRAFT_2832781 [Lactarius hatsudake]|nr:hypothetical protein EDB86DRAFT_2832781 [Lactarius hatsudake]